MTTSTRHNIPKISGLRLLKYVWPLYKKPLPTLQNIVDTYGHLIEFNAGKHQQLFFVSDAESVKHILKTNKSNFKRSPVIKALKPLLGNGIFISENATWKEQHKQLRPAFHESIIREYETAVSQEVQTLLDKWGGQTTFISIEEDIELMMLRMLVKTQFSSTIELDYQKILRTHKTVLEETSIKWQKIDFFINKVRKSIGLKPKSKKNSSAVEYLHQVATDIINHIQNDPNSGGYVIKEMIVNNDDETAIRDLILNLIFAGYDTTASALSWTLLALAENIEEQEKVHNEIKDTNITFRSISQFEYSKMAIQEAMRLYPPVWSIHRRSEQGDELKGVKFNGGSYFMICVYTLHRDAEVWLRPNSFYPNHFLPENIRGKAFQYIPFGQGERICIGKPLAMNELQYILPMLLQKFKFTKANNKQVDIHPGIIIKSKAGIKLRAEVRN